MSILKIIPLLFLTVNAFAAENVVLVQTGEQKIISRSKTGLKGFTVVNPKIARITIEKSGIKILGLKPGEAHLLSQRRDLKIVIFAASIKTPKEAVEEWLKNTGGIQIEVQPKKILLTGQALRLNDWKKLQQLRQEFQPLIESRVRLTPRLQGALKNSVQSSLREKSIISAQLTENDGTLKIATSAQKKDEKNTIKQIADEWGLDAPNTTQNIELRPMIEIDIIIAEMKKNRARSLGLELPGTYSASILPSGDLSSFATNFDSINPQFHASLTEAMGKVLANPKLLCRSGEVAHFVAGGEIPIKIHSRMTADVVWKRYGVILDITPLADLNDGISTGLVTEISLLDAAHTIDGIPGLLTNRIETHFDLRGSKTIALSGLIKSETGRDSSTIPLLGEIPIIGELFKSRDFKENRTELVVFVTPKVISPENPPEAQVLPRWTDDP